MSQFRRVEQCPACGANSSQAVRVFDAAMTGHTGRILRCSDCSLIYKEFFPVTPALDELYETDYVHFQEQLTTTADFFSAKQKLAVCTKLLKLEDTGNNKHKIRLLDVGCGAGAFVDIALKLGYDAEGIDPYLPAKLQSNRLSNKPLAEVPPGLYDVVVLLNVAEHLEYPQATFKAVRRLLRPGGVMLLTCPFGNSWAFRVHRAQWTHLVLEEHLLFWTPASLTRMLRGVGFEGVFRHRVAGSPFPFGRTAVAKPRPTVSGKFAPSENLPLADLYSQNTNNSTIMQVLQSKVWKTARAIQHHETTANLVRLLINVTRSGDYLEYIIRADS